jgi:hypothetical protein
MIPALPALLLAVLGLVSIGHPQLPASRARPHGLRSADEFVVMEYAIPSTKVRLSTECATAFGLWFGVHSGVAGRIHDLKIVHPVVRLIVVSVVNYFRGLEKSTYVPLHNQPVLPDIAVSCFVWVIRGLEEYVSSPHDDFLPSHRLSIDPL